MKIADFQSDELSYRVPPLVNNLTQKTEKNVFSLDQYASWKKSNGGITKFAFAKSKAKQRILESVAKQVK
jgi:hypothetical protein